MLKYKKLLIVENFIHYKNSIENLKFFHKDFDCKLLIPSSEINKVKNTSTKKFLKIYSGPKILIYFYLMLNSKNYNYIYISTPPEYPDNIKSFKNFILFSAYFFSFIIFLVFFQKKIIIQIRSLHRYFPEHNKYSYLPYFRFWIIFFSNRIVVESNFLKKKILEILKKHKLKKLVSSIYISHLYNRKINKNNNKLIIGVLGSIDPIRKNYNILFQFLEMLKKKSKKITIIFLGKSNKRATSEYLKVFQKKYNIKYFNNYLNEDNFQKWGLKCNYLFSLNTKTNFYGNYRLSGSFGDAIGLKKLLFAPLFEDPSREFKDFTIYYKNPLDLYKKFLKKKKKISFSRFYYKKYVQNTIKELKL